MDGGWMVDGWSRCSMNRGWMKWVEDKWSGWSGWWVKKEWFRMMK